MALLAGIGAGLESLGGSMQGHEKEAREAEREQARRAADQQRAENLIRLRAQLNKEASVEQDERRHGHALGELEAKHEYKLKEHEAGIRPQGQLPYQLGADRRGDPFVFNRGTGETSSLNGAPPPPGTATNPDPTPTKRPSGDATSPTRTPAPAKGASESEQTETTETSEPESKETESKETDTKMIELPLVKSGQTLMVPAWQMNRINKARRGTSLRALELEIDRLETSQEEKEALYNFLKDKHPQLQ